MPRANRYHLPGHLWHVTHRCHKQEFLLKFLRDRRVWERWLYEARRRYGLCVLNYVATSNHIHLLLKDQGRDEIPASMRLIAGRTAQAFNRRKGRQGAYWQDRYHATAVESGKHLARCLVYIDLNMVRAGVVQYPGQWQVCGFHEIQCPRKRYRIVDRQALADAVGVHRVDALSSIHREWVTMTLRDGRSARDPRWTEALAVGSEAFVRRAHTQLDVRALDRGLHVDPKDGVAHLAEDGGYYRRLFAR